MCDFLIKVVNRSIYYYTLRELVKINANFLRYIRLDHTLYSINYGNIY